jgi:hypothetical protein
MVTQQNNRISVVITAEQIKKVKTLMQEVNATLPFLLGLSPNERKTLPKIDVSNKVFVEDSLNAVRNNPDMLPAYMKYEEMKKDFDGFVALDELEKMAQQLFQKIVDTRMLMGSEAYVSGLTAYRLFEAASNAGVPGASAAYQALRQRFLQTASNAAVTPEEPKTT